MVVESRLDLDVKEIVESVIGSELRSSSGLLDEAVLDSLSTMKVITAIEAKFNITFDTKDFTHYNFNSIATMVELVAARRESRPSQP